jgi:transcriptional regulator GlxA family with amidase domain
MTGPASVFANAASNGRQHYSLKVLTTEPGGEVTSLGGITIANAALYSEYSGPIDTLIAIGGEGASLDYHPLELIRWIRKRAPHTRRIASVCTGAFVLAPTGLLDGKRVTTHWRYIEILAQRYRQLLIERDPIFIKDGKVYTTAGVSAGIDLALSLVEEDLGRAEAAAVARHMVLFLRRPGNQAQYSTLLAQQADVGGTRMRDLPAWVNSRLTQKLDVATLATVVSMTPRTFARQFELTFRMTPARWIQSLRVEAARQHIEERDLPFKGIARLVGFREEQSLRRAFIQQFAMTPKEYRERFGTTLH